MFKTVKITGIILVLVSFVLLIAFFATMGQGSESIDSAAGEAIHVPLLTDTIIYWGYLLFGIAIVVTIAMALFQFIKSLASNPAAALKSLIPIILFAGIFVVSYFAGSSEKMSIIGYEGTQNAGVWAQVSDMFMYTIYTLFVLIIAAILGARIYTALK
jgi:phosphoglycerol transferase MdoB-like AlkP superfamily enzyme